MNNEAKRKKLQPSTMFITAIIKTGNYNDCLTG